MNVLESIKPMGKEQKLGAYQTWKKTMYHHPSEIQRCFVTSPAHWATLFFTAVAIVTKRWWRNASLFCVWSCTSNDDVIFPCTLLLQQVDMSNSTMVLPSDGCTNWVYYTWALLQWRLSCFFSPEFSPLFSNFHVMYDAPSTICWWVSMVYMKRILSPWMLTL